MIRVLLIFFALLFASISFAQNMNDLIPVNTATHTALQSGDWFDPSIWDAGTVPSDAAIVVIPGGITVNFEGESNANIFAIRVDGNFNCVQSNDNQTSKLTFDTFVGTLNSVITFEASGATDGSIEVIISPFDIESYKAGTSSFPMIWNANAINYFSDGAPVQEVVYDVGPDNRFNSYAEALAGNTSVTETSIGLVDDGPGVLGRYQWDSTQVSLGLVTMGEIIINGKSKTYRSKLSADAAKNQPILELETTPTGWSPGDRLIVTRGGNQTTTSNGEDEVVIQSINGNTVTCTTNLLKNHEGYAPENLHCYVGNLTRNITFRSDSVNNIHQRGHFMVMFNDANVQVRNAAFVEMGRTDKSKLLDDYVWNNWLEPKVFNSKISALGQECVQMRLNPKEKITNMRGRYSIHLHQTGSTANSTLTSVTGNVVEGNPGWGITQHNSYADVSDNVVYKITGAAIVSESGSEMGFWDDNLVVDVSVGHSTDMYTAALFHDDYLFSGQGLGMKGRAVICRGNVIANAQKGVGINNLNPSLTNQDRVDPDALASLRPGFEFDQFPLSKNGYSVEGNGVMPVEVALIMENTTVIGCYQGLRSIERDMGVNHESRSIFDGFYAWGINQGLSITYQADYSFRDVFISGKNMNAVGAYLWKHSHNHVFEDIRMKDLGHGVTVSKLVETGQGELKTRNNGFTPWYFIDLQIDNVTEFYEIVPESATVTYPYTEHGDNPVHLSSSDINHRPVTFTILDSNELYIDYSGDLRFELDGIITDDLGSYDLGIKQAWAQGNLRLDYPERLYEFASTQKLDEYVAANGVFEHPETGELYIIIEEWLPNRRTYEYEPFKIRVPILNAPSTGLYANPQQENESEFYPQLQIVSRLASVTQSSTDPALYYDTALIDPSAWKAIDGNNNGRINAQFFQQWLVPIGSISSTLVENEPWFDLDLGELKEIEFIDIWNTVDLNGTAIENPSSHFTDFYVMISDTAFTGLSLNQSLALADYSYHNTNAPSRKFSLDSIGAIGQFVRVQAVGTNKLAMAEIEILGKSHQPCLYVQDGVDIQESCGPFQWIDGVTYTSSTNTPSFTIQTAGGCDSLVTLDLTINEPSDTTLTETALDEYVLNGQTYTQSGTYTQVLTNDVGCDSTITLNLTIEYTGLNDKELSLSVFPNPASDFITIVVDDGISGGYRIIDVHGKLLLSGKLISDKTNVNISSLEKGCYYIQLEEELRTIPFIK